MPDAGQEEIESLLKLLEQRAQLLPADAMRILVRVCVCVCACACLCAYVCARVRAGVRAGVYVRTAR